MKCQSFLLVGLFAILLPALSLGWPDSSTVVSDIEIIGHRVTKEYVIRREIQHPIGVPLDSTVAAEDRNRIENLGIFSGAYWEAIPKKDGTVALIFRVVESWRFLPGAMPIYQEDTGWSLSGGVMIKNFRGRNENLNFGGSIGGMTTYGLEFLDPWILGDHISLSASAGRTFYAHPFLPYDQVTLSLEATVGRYFGYERKLNVGFELERKSFSGPGDTLTYTYVSPQITVMYDTRDVYTDPSRGVLVVQNLYTMFDLTGRALHYGLWYQSYSVYRTWVPGDRKLTAGFNLAGSTVFGQLEEVWVNYLGGANTVRGWIVPDRNTYADKSSKFRFGYHWVVSSVELRQTIVPRYVTKWRNEFGLIAAGFLDLGYASVRREGLLDGPPMLGMGVGIRIPWPIVGILRFDYGWSFRGGKYMGRAFHFSVGQKF